MKKIILILTMATCALTFAQDKQIFESPKLQDFIARHRKVAILPFKASITFRKLPKDFNADANKADEVKLGYEMQSGMYTYLLRKTDDYTVEVQDTERTNALLRKNNLIDKLDETAPEELARILEVDAVIKCAYSYQKTKSEAGAIVLTYLVGFGAGSVANGTLTMQINDGIQGELVWRFYKQMAENVMSSPAYLMERMMRKVGRNFPYQK